MNSLAPYLIREASAQDIVSIRTIALKTWPDTFSEVLSTDQIAYMLDLMYSQAALEEQMHKNNHGFLVLSQGEKDLAYASFELHYHFSLTIKIHKLYSLPEFQGKGIGRKLLDHISSIGLAAGMNQLSLNVNRDNKALGFYQHYGFEVKASEDISIGNGFYMNDFILQKPLSIHLPSKSANC